MSEQSQEQLQNEIASLKVRIFDAEEAAKQNGQMVQQIVEFVVGTVGLEGVESIETFAKALQEKFPQEVEAEAE